MSKVKLKLLQKLRIKCPALEQMKETRKNASGFKIHKHNVKLRLYDVPAQYIVFHFFLHCIKAGVSKLWPADWIHTPFFFPPGDPCLPTVPKYCHGQLLPGWAPAILGRHSRSQQHLGTIGAIVTLLPSGTVSASHARNPFPWMQQSPV